MYLKLDKQTIEIVEAKSFYSRLKGLMGQETISKGMLFRECNSIHTFFMKANIDVIGLNEQNQVIYIYRNLPKNQIVRIQSNIKKTSILELPVNASKKIKMGSVLLFKDKNVV